MNLQDVHIFVKVAESGSFVAAARELGLSCPAVSRHVSRLENDLGVQLLWRSTRKLVLSEHGQRFFERAKAAIAELLEAGTETMSANADLKGSLSVKSDLGAGQCLIGPAISEFVKTNPEVSIDLTIGTASIDALAKDFDIVVTDKARANAPGIAQYHLVNVRYVVCASPKYLKVAGTPKHPRDLVNYNCLVNEARTVASEWRFRQGSREIGVHVNGSMRSNDGGAIVDAVLGGAGIAHLPNYAVAEPIRKRQLMVLFHNVVTPQRDVVACHVRTPHPPARLVAFLDFLVAFSKRWTHIETRKNHKLPT